MKILVIGGTGKVGAEVVKELQKRKADIRLLVRKDGTPTPRGVDFQIGSALRPNSALDVLTRIQSTPCRDLFVQRMYELHSLLGHLSG